MCCMCLQRHKKKRCPFVSLRSNESRLLFVLTRLYPDDTEPNTTGTIMILNFSLHPQTNVLGGTELIQSHPYVTNNDLQAHLT